MHIQQQQQQQQQQQLANQNGTTMFGSQSVFMQSPATTSSATPSESMLPFSFFSETVKCVLCYDGILFSGHYG